MDGAEGDAWRASLANRMEQVRDGVADVQVVVIESIVPGQRFSITAPPQLVDLLTGSYEGTPIVMLGRQGSSVARHGVEVKVEQVVKRPVVPGIHPEGTADVTLRACRLCEVVELLEKGVSVPWLGRHGRARWIPFEEEDTHASSDNVARAEALDASVQEWIALVRETAKEPGLRQLASKLENMGPMPPATEPNRRALWAAGLVSASNGQGGDIRTEVMAAPSAARRLDTVERAILFSTRIMQRQSGKQ